MAGVHGSFLGLPELVTHTQGSSKMKHHSFIFTVLGFHTSTVTADTRLSLVTRSKEASFYQLAKHPDLYDMLSHNLFPHLYGDHLLEVKRALLCALVGGVAKVGFLISISQGKEMLS